MTERLDTAQDVLEWARGCEPAASPYGEHRKEQWLSRLQDDTEKATYLAECVRLRQAFDALEKAHTEYCGGYHAITEADLKVGQCIMHLRDAMKGDACAHEWETMCFTSNPPRYKTACRKCGAMKGDK